MLTADRTAVAATLSRPAYRAGSGAVTTTPGRLAGPLASLRDALRTALAEAAGDQLQLAQGEAQARDLAGQPLVEAGAGVARGRHRDDLAGADAEAKGRTIGADLHGLPDMAGHGRDLALGDAAAVAQLLVEEGVQVLHRG